MNSLNYNMSKTRITEGNGKEGKEEGGKRKKEEAEKNNLNTLPMEIIKKIEYELRGGMEYRELWPHNDGFQDCLNLSLALGLFDTEVEKDREVITSTLSVDKWGFYPIGITFERDDTGMWTSNTVGCCSAICKYRLPSLIRYGSIVSSEKALEMFKSCKLQYNAWGHPLWSAYHMFGKFENEYRFGSRRDTAEFQIRLTHKEEGDKKWVYLTPQSLKMKDIEDYQIEGSNRYGMATYQIPSEVINIITSNLELTRDITNFKIATKQFVISNDKVYIQGDDVVDLRLRMDLDQPDGFCYLSCVRRRYQTLLRYGACLDGNDLLNMLKKGELVQDNIFFNYSGAGVGHLSNRRTNHCTRVTLLSKIDPTIEIPLGRKNIQLIQTDKWSANVKCRWIGSTGGFSLRDLTNFQQTIVGYHCPEPDLYQSQGKHINEPNVTLSGPHITIASEEVNRTFNINNEDFGRIRHEYVANKLRESTDMKLSVLGIRGEEALLTPDFIDVANKKVCELGTSRTDSITTLFEEFNSKKLKYDYLIKPIHCNTYYIIVGLNAVVTNMILTQSMVDDLCARFRIGVQLEMKIIELLGYDPFNKRSTEDIRIAKAIFSQMNIGHTQSNEFFNIAEILSTTEAPTEQDTLHSRDIMSKCFVESIPRKPSSRNVLNEYLDKFHLGECQTSSKRITNIPLLLNRTAILSVKPMDEHNSDMPMYMRKLWGSARQIEHKRLTLQEAIDDANRDNSEFNENKHTWKKESIFRAELTHQDKVELALTGVGAKFLRNIDSVMDHEKTSKKSFHPNSPSRDIEEFIVHSSLKSGFLRTSDVIIDMIAKSKSICTRNSTQDSVRLWKKILDMRLVSFFDQCSEIFTELSYNYKHWTSGDQFMIKETISGIKMLIRNTGTHLFVSFAFPKPSTIILDTGRLGPLIYSSDNYYYTDFASFNEPTLEHFVKAGPYMSSLLIHLMSNFEMEPGEINANLEQTFNFISLLYLNNKTDVEELITSQRYLFMKLFEDATQDPYLFVDRLPEVLRSRLSAYLLQRTIKLMDYYSENRVIKVPKAEGDVVLYNYLNIKSIINHSDLTLNQKINEFYFGYVVSKERGRGSDRNFKIVKKILQEEYRFRDTVKSVFLPMNDGMKTYSTDPQLMKVFLHIFKYVLKDKIGDNFKEVLLNDFLENLSFANFTQLATLKASARDHGDLIRLPENLDQDRTKLLKELNKLNEKESSKRPKVLEAFISLVKKFHEETGHRVRHMMQLIPWCLKDLEKKGFFDSDIFPKPQHGGDREIHVLEIRARVIQFTLELISKTICKYFMSETITHPETKNHFVRQHYKETSNTFKSSFVISKSADASKWCQRHHVSHFASMMVSATPYILNGFIIRSLKLWTNKKISFPLQLSATLLSNKTTASNPIFERFRDEFFSGTGLFEECMSNKMTIKSGMMQGILHYTSSLYHTMIQEVMRIFVIRTARSRFNMGVTCTIVQGSDDSGMMLGVEGKISKQKISNCYVLLRMKEEISQYLSVYWNKCKSSIGTIDLIEYNSEWFSRMRSIKPTFRWVSACMELSVTERFIDRIRILNQVISQCLEGGASTLECAIIQLNQAWLHYMMLGMTTSSLATVIKDLLLECCNPQLGFFPLDYDLACGIPGVDCQIYNLAITGKYIVPAIDDDSMVQYEFDGQNKSLVPKDLRSVKLRFGKLHIWMKLVERINLGTLEDAIERIQRDPMLLFGRHTSWDEEVPNLIIKVFSPGVKESLNNISSSLRMMAASAYIVNRPCLSIYQDGELIKLSLYKALQKCKLEKNKMFNSMRHIRTCFPLGDDYEQLLAYLTTVSNSHETFEQSFSRSNKEEIKVFEVLKNEINLIDLCKRRWNLGGKVVLSSRQFETFWSQAKIRYPFLTNDIFSTAANLNMTIIELKNFLESLKLKDRKIVLYDSAARSGGIESAITRIYWPNVKVRSGMESQLDNINHLRSTLFSILTFWLSDTQTSKIVGETIQKSKFLRKEYGNIPNKAKKIKTIFDWTQNAPKSNLIQQIRIQRQGVIGYFTKKQKGWGSNLQGEGEWRGQIMGISCVIRMKNNSTHYVELRQLSDILTLGPAIKTLLEEFKTNTPSGEFESNLMLSQSGKITTSKHQDGVYIPIIIKEDLSIDVISSMEDMNWNLETRGTTIRLILTDNSHGENVKYTILSETLSQKDWNPNYSLNSSDVSLNNWSNDQVAQISMLEAHLSDEIPVSNASFLRFKSHLDGKISRNGWDLSKFRSRLISVLIDPIEALQTSKPEILEDLPMSISSLLEVQQIMHGISSAFLEEDFNESNLNWADSVIDSEDDNDLSGEMTDEIVKSISALNEDLRGIYENPDRENFDDKMWMKMASSNRFFSNLDKLCEIQVGKRFHEAYKEMKVDETISLNGLLGKIMSLALKRLVFSGWDQHETLADIVSESSRQVDTIMSETDLNKMDLSSIEETISQLTSILDNLPQGSARVEVEKSIAKYHRLRLLKVTPEPIGDLETLNYGEIMTIVVNHIFENNLSKFSEHNVGDNLKLSLIKVEISDKLDELIRERAISNHEFTIMREQVNRNEITSNLLNVINETYGIKLDLSTYNQTKNPGDLITHEHMV